MLIDLRDNMPRIALVPATGCMCRNESEAAALLGINQRVCVRKRTRLEPNFVFLPMTFDGLAKCLAKIKSSLSRVLLFV